MVILRTLSWLVLPLFFSCQKAVNTFKQSGDTERIVRAYKIPPLYGNQIDQALGRILGTKVTTTYLSKGEGASGEEVSRVEPEVGRATLAAPDVLAVSAPESIQQGIPDFIETLVDAKTDSLEQINVDLYAVIEVSGVKTAKTDFHPSLSSVLVENIVGSGSAAFPAPLRCTVEVEHLFSKSMSGVRIKSRGNYINLNAKILPLQDRYIGDLEVRTSRGLSGDFETRVSLLNGEPTKISESSVEMNKVPDVVRRTCNIPDQSKESQSSEVSAKIIFALKMASADVQK